MQEVATLTANNLRLLVNASKMPMQADLISLKQRGVSSQKTCLKEELIATLWLQLTDIYGARFVNQYGEKDSGMWFQALNDLNEDLLCFGLTAMLRDVRFETWPPNCTQFRHLCLTKPETASLPSVHEAYREARENLWHKGVRSWSHPAVKFTVKHVGLAVVSDARQHIAFPAFRACYERVCQRISEGRNVPHVADEELVMSQTRGMPLEDFERLMQTLRGNLNKRQEK